MALLAHEGFDPAFGARPLKRVIQREIGDRAAVLMLEGKVADGGTIRVDAAADEQRRRCRPPGALGVGRGLMHGS